MKRILVFPTFFFAMNLFAAEPFVVSLNPGDSSRFYDVLAKLGGLVTTPAPDGSANWTITANFNSTNQALTLTCIKSFASGLDMGSTCKVVMDAEKSDPNQTEIKTGIIGGVKGAMIHNVLDAQPLASALAPLGFFQTSEQVNTTLPSGQHAQYPKFRASCSSQSGALSCQLNAFPSN